MTTALLWKVLALASTVGAAWLLTYALHSTILIAGAWIAERTRLLRSLRARDLAWRTALLGGLFTATLQLGVGHHPWAGSTALRAPEVPAASEVAAALHRGVEGSPVPVRTEVKEGGVPEGSTPTPRSVAVVYRPKDKTVVVEVPRPPHRVVPPAEQPQRREPGPAEHVLLRSDPGAAPMAWGRTLARLGESVASPAFIIWVVIASALLLRLAVRRARLLASLGERSPVVEPLVLARLAGLCRDVQHSRAVKLTTADGLRSPVALGWGEICLPAQAVEELDAAQQRSVLAHELAHLRRLDPVWLLFASVLEQLLFFQPLNRLARARMQEVAEYLCDDWAAARDGSGLSVAQGLASVAGWLDGRETVVPLAGMAEQPSQLLARVQRLLQNHAGEVERLRAWHVFGVITLLAVTVLAAPGVRAAPEQSLLAAHRGQPRPNPQADAGAAPEPAPSTRAMVAVQAIDSALVETPASVSSGDAPAAKDAPATAPAPERSPATERKQQDRAPDSKHRSPKPSRTEDAAPRGERSHAGVSVATASASGTEIAGPTEAPVATARSVTALEPEVVTRPRVVAAVSTGTTMAVAPAVVASVPPVPPVPPVPAVAPVPPVPPVPLALGMSNAEIERIQRDAQRMAADAQRRAQDAVRRAQARSKARHKGRHAERAPADPKTVDALISALKDSDPGVRQAAAESLGRIGDPRAIDPLGGLMGDSTIDVRRAAVEALGNIDDPKVVPALTRATSDANPLVRREAAEALLGVDDEAATPPLVKLLSDSDPKVRVTALEGLSRRGDKRALEPLAKLVKDPNVEVRSRAVRALARFKDPASQSALVAALKDENPEVRQAAAEALGQLELKSAPQGLLDATRDSSSDVRQAAAEALGEIHDSKAVPQLKALLDDPSADVRSAAVEALSEIRDSSALQALIAAMQSKDVTVRRAAAQALGQRE